MVIYLAPRALQRLKWEDVQKPSRATIAGGMCPMQQDLLISGGPVAYSGRFEARCRKRCAAGVNGRRWAGGRERWEAAGEDSGRGRRAGTAGRDNGERRRRHEATRRAWSVHGRSTERGGGGIGGRKAGALWPGITDCGISEEGYACIKRCEETALARRGCESGGRAGAGGRWDALQAG
ncbi:hypothetical protein C8R44DRAFT_733869 [Mycena epipterygia]|nr:hypothetical protein C8R44DRAFT_733869 [Mycena epipterygia]